MASNLITASYCDTDPSRLCFESIDSSANFGAEPVQNNDGRVTVYKRGFVERYKNLDLEIIVHLSVPSVACNYDLVFCAVPGKSIAWYPKVTAADLSDMHIDGTRSPCHWSEQPMLIGVGYRVQCNEDLVSSLVWLERAKQRENLIWEILGPPANRVFEVIGSTGEGEDSVSRVDLASGNSNGVACVVESVSQIVCGIGNDARAFEGDWLRKLQLLNLIAGSRIYLNNHSATFVSEEVLFQGVQFLGVSLCPSDFVAGAIEDHQM